MTGATPPPRARPCHVLLARQAVPHARACLDTLVHLPLTPLLESTLGAALVFSFSTFDNPYSCPLPCKRIWRTLMCLWRRHVRPSYIRSCLSVVFRKLFKCVALPLCLGIVSSRCNCLPLPSVHANAYPPSCFMSDLFVRSSELFVQPRLCWSSPIRLGVAILLGLVQR